MGPYLRRWVQHKFHVHLGGFVLIYTRIWWASNLHGNSPLETLDNMRNSSIFHEKKVTNKEVDHPTHGSIMIVERLGETSILCLTRVIWSILHG